MKYYSKNTSLIRYALPSTKLLVFGITSYLIGIAVMGIIQIFKKVVMNIPGDIDIARFNPAFLVLYLMVIITLGIGVVSVFLVPFVLLITPDSVRIRRMVCKGLFEYRYGNPLKLKEYELLPKIRCRRQRAGLFELTISATSTSIEELRKLSSNISSILNKRYYRYAVTKTTSDLAFNHVTFSIEDVTVDNSLVINNINELRPTDPTKLKLDKVHNLDLRYSGSILVAGKTRSGKTTAIISLLLQTLLMGRDNYDSQIVIIDPKRAELSCLPNVVTLDQDGGAREILQAMRKFADTITKRQKILNDLLEKDGNAVHWWDVDMHPSYIFIDEYVALRSLFPRHSPKEEPGYCLPEFDSLLRRIVTMGASSGSFAIISVAEASVDDKSGAGIPSMIRSACKTKILFTPTDSEGKLLWNSELLTDFNTGRIYLAGDSLFTCEDGKNNFPTYLHFPELKFGEYNELGKLLTRYYAK